MTNKIVKKSKDKPKYSNTPNSPRAVYKDNHEFYIKEAEDLAQKGLTLDMIADCLSIPRTTFYEWKAKHAQFSEALRRGRARGVKDAAEFMQQSDKIEAKQFILKYRANWIEPEKLKNLELREREIQLKYDIFALNKEQLIVALVKEAQKDKNSDQNMFTIEKVKELFDRHINRKVIDFNLSEYE